MIVKEDVESRNLSTQSGYLSIVFLLVTQTTLALSYLAKPHCFFFSLKFNIGTLN